MRKLTETVIIALLVMLLATACSDDSSSDSGMTESEYELVKEILALKDDVYNWAQDYAEWSDDDFAFIDTDGDGEYDEGESIIYAYINYYYGEDYGEDYDGEIDYDYDEVRVYSETFDYTSQDGSAAVSGSFTRISVYVGYDDYTSGDADTYTQYRTYIYDLSATVDGEEHTLEMTLYQTRICEGTNVISKTWTGSEAVLDGAVVTGYEDLANAE